MPDGRTLAIANGGIETHPDFGRAELNLDTMEPSLAFVDAPTGDLIGLLKLDAGLHQLSIRHMAVDARNRVWFGCQFRGRIDANASTRRLRDARRRHPADRAAARYAGRAPQLCRLGRRVAPMATLIAVSSPEGDSMLAIDAAALRPAATLVLRDGCGLAADGAGFLASSGEGELIGFAGSSAPAQQLSIKFDNHLRLFRA